MVDMIVGSRHNVSQGLADMELIVDNKKYLLEVAVADPLPVEVLLGNDIRTSNQTHSQDSLTRGVETLKTVLSGKALVVTTRQQTARGREAMCSRRIQQWHSPESYIEENGDPVYIKF